jgi:hypothetical protein
MENCANEIIGIARFMVLGTNYAVYFSDSSSNAIHRQIILQDELCTQPTYIICIDRRSIFFQHLYADKLLSDKLSPHICLSWSTQITCL